jgi:glycine cleavage system H protein
MSTQNLKFTKQHEWAKVDGDVVTMGISDYAQGQFGDIVYIELPAVGDTVTQNESCGNIESVKAVEDFYAPVSGEVTEINGTLESAPENVNKEPYGSGWFCKVKMSNPSELDALMDNAAYEEFLKSIEE